MIEVMLAIFVLTTGIIAIYSLVPRIISLNSFNTNKFISSQLAIEGMEIIKNMRDGNWLEYRVSTSTPWNEGQMNDLEIEEGDYEVSYDMADWEDPPLDYCGLVESCSYDNLKFLGKDSEGFYGYNYVSGNESRFKRKVTVEKPEADILEVTTKVYWSENKFFSVKERIYNWR